MENSFKSLFQSSVRHRIIEDKTSKLVKFIGSFSKRKLVSVKCKPWIEADRKRCFVNVESRIERFGGRMVTGWIFNEYEDRYIEGEAHAIWVDRYGKKRVDITPHDHQPIKVLFLPDKRVAEKRGYTNPPKLMLTDDWRMVAIERFESIMHELREAKFQGFGKEMIITNDEYLDALDASGLPDDVGKFLIGKIQDSDDRAWSLHGGS